MLGRRVFEPQGFVYFLLHVMVLVSIVLKCSSFQAEGDELAMGAMGEAEGAPPAGAVRIFPSGTVTVSVA